MDRLVNLQLRGNMANALQRILIRPGIAGSDIATLLLGQAKVADSMLRREFSRGITGDG